MSRQSLEHGRRHPPQRTARAVLLLAPMLAAALLVGGTAHAQRPPARQALSDQPGFVDLGALGLSTDDATLEIFLEGALIRMVAEAVRGEDARFAELLEQLQSVRVQVFSLADSDEGSLLRRGDDAIRRLEDGGWQPVFRVREQGERVYLYLKHDAAGSIAGVFVLAAEPGDSVTLVNIVGNLDPVELGRLGASLRIDPLQMLGRMARERQGQGESADGNEDEEDEP